VPSARAQTSHVIKSWKYRTCVLPKAASTNQHMLADKLNQTPPVNKRDGPWTSVVVLREPHERLLSTYLDSHPWYPPYPRSYPPWNEFPNNPMYIKRMGVTWVTCENRSMYFDGFIHKLTALLVSGKRIDEHINPQRILCRGDFNHTILYDDMEKGFEKVLREIGAWETVGATGWGKGSKEHFMAPRAVTENSHGIGTTIRLLPLFYSAATWELVNVAFARDMEYFPHARDMQSYLKAKIPGLATQGGGFFSQTTQEELRKMVRKADWCFHDPSHDPKRYCGCGEVLLYNDLLSSGSFV